MLRFLKKPAAFMVARWRVWLPPVAVTTLVFAIVLLLTNGKFAMPFLYKLS